MTRKEFNDLLKTIGAKEANEKRLARYRKTAEAKARHEAKAHEYRKQIKNLLWYWKHGEWFDYFQFEPFERIGK